MTIPAGILTSQDKKIFWWSVGLTCLWQGVVLQVALADRGMWINQIQYFFTHDPHQFDFFQAYCEPGTTLVGLGALFHLLFGLSYSTCYDLAMLTFFAFSIGFCSMLCQMICPNRPWWFTTLIFLNINRLYLSSTPPTALVLPVACALFLLTCWLWDKRLLPKHQHLTWGLCGVIVGVSAADRVDASILLGVPFFLLLTSRFGFRFLLWSIPSSMVTFFICDPYLWFMPIQHLIDFWLKFNLHYSHFVYTVTISWDDWLIEGHLCAISIVWFIVLFRGQKIQKELPVQPILLLLTTLIAAIALLSRSKFQAIRYLFPLIIIWEILLPLFVMISFSCEKRKNPDPKVEPKSPFHFDHRSERLLALVILPVQVLEYLLSFL
jgi:hypothetical protein